jgi:hypothetical protein
VMSIPAITRSEVPVFLIVIVFPDVPPSFVFPKLTDIGVTDMLGVPACIGVAEKVQKMSPKIIENTTEGFNFIRLSPYFFKIMTSLLVKK